MNSKTNDLVLLLKTIRRYWKCFLSPVATDGMDEDGLKLEKIGQFFQVFMLHVPKIFKKFIMVSPRAQIKLIWYLRRSFPKAFCLWLKPQSNDFSIELAYSTQQNPPDTAPLRFSVYIDWPSVLIMNNVRLHQEPMTQKQWKTFV